MATFVIKLGGSFLLAGGAPNTAAINGMAATVKSIADSGHRLVVVVGGGVVARQYVNAAAALGSNNGVKDHFGILVRAPPCLRAWPAGRSRASYTGCVSAGWALEDRVKRGRAGTLTPTPPSQCRASMHDCSSRHSTMMPACARSRASRCSRCAPCLRSSLSWCWEVCSPASRPRVWPRCAPSTARPSASFSARMSTVFTTRIPKRFRFFSSFWTRSLAHVGAAH